MFWKVLSVLIIKLIFDFNETAFLVDYSQTIELEIINLSLPVIVVYSHWFCSITPIAVFFFFLWWHIYFAGRQNLPRNIWLTYPADVFSTWLGTVVWNRCPWLSISVLQTILNKSFLLVFLLQTFSLISHFVLVVYFLEYLCKENVPLCLGQWWLRRVYVLCTEQYEIHVAIITAVILVVGWCVTNDQNKHIL